MILKVKLKLFGDDRNYLIQIKPVLFNRYFTSLKYIFPRPDRWEQDRYLNHYVIYEGDNLPSSEITYEVQLSSLKYLPDAIFEDPGYLLFKRQVFVDLKINISQFIYYIQKKCKDFTRWEVCIRDRYFDEVSKYPNACEIFSAMVGHLAYHMDCRIAYFQGFIYGTDIGHAWTAVECNGKRMIIDPAWPFSRERRFVKVINSRIEEIAKYRISPSINNRPPFTLEIKSQIIWKTKDY